MQESQKLQACMRQIIDIKDKKTQNIDQIIAKYFPIVIPELQELDVPLGQPHQRTYDQKFVPSLDLLKTFQSTYSKTLDGKQPSTLVNSKLQRLYSNTSKILQNTLPLKQHKKKGDWVMIQQKQKNMLQVVKQGQYLSTLPIIEQSLKKNELKNLNNKNIALQNSLNLEKWKEMRKKYEKNLSK